MHERSVLGSYKARFLVDYWQKKPLLIRGAFPGGLTAVDPDSLAGLACQEGIDSRIVLEHGAYPWETHQGPFAESFFEKLPSSHWTLLVQAVDRLLPEVSQLRESFQFLPNWRLDDIMISYAADHGSVGPHTDNYDVFLIQAIGKRRWQFGEHAIPAPEFIDGLDLKILKNFEVKNDFVLEPGDMLYLPPLIAHHGVAVGECMTYSVGFRAPTQNELLVSYSQFLLQSENPEIFYQDHFASALDAQAAQPGLIREDELDRLRELMISSLRDANVFRRWIGAFLTEPRNFHEPSDEPVAVDGIRKLLHAENENGKQLFKVEGGRFAYYRDAAKVYLAVEGETVVVSKELFGLVTYLSEHETYDFKTILQYEATEGFDDLLAHLWNQGFLRRGERA
ncbi:MAG: cupin domain-containing protein [Chitinophagaceae bacterium]|nr:cupin domain-containing protein [Oligoflexus sp.]